MDKTAIRDAATVIVLRQTAGGTAVLLGQRGENAAFMPSKFVFPGGAVDREDARVSALTHDLSPLCLTRLAYRSAAGSPQALVAAAIRELWEETGLRLSRPGNWQIALPQQWCGFAEGGHVPDASALRFVFRAITPPGRPRRFDARFFLTWADALIGDPDDFSGACDELSHLQWVLLDDTRKFDLPFITQIVLREIAGLPMRQAPPDSVPFFDHGSDTSRFERIS
ncbi:MAG: NUDIX hydrolase [Brevirhabdus sp.]